MLPPLSLTLFALLLLPYIAHGQTRRPNRSGRRAPRDHVFQLSGNFKLTAASRGPIARQGNYEIRCGDYNDHMQRVVALGCDAARFALNDLRSGAPSHGFKQLFKNSPRSEVEATLQQVADGCSRRDNVRLNHFPSIVCANRGTQIAYNLPKFWIKTCEDNLFFAFYVQPTAYIVICNDFFSLPLIPPKLNRPPKPHICPVWLPDRQQIAEVDQEGAYTYLYQAFVIIHEAVHFYRPASLGVDGRSPHEQYEWKGMMDLRPQFQLENPTNYEAYVAMVWSDCQLDVHSRHKAGVANIVAYNEMLQMHHQHTAAMTAQTLAHTEMMRMHHQMAMMHAQTYLQHAAAMHPQGQPYNEMIQLYHQHPPVMMVSAFHPQAVAMNAQAQAYNDMLRMHHEQIMMNAQPYHQQALTNVPHEMAQTPPWPPTAPRRGF